MKRESYITFPIFKNHPELLCVFSTRKGGFSKGKYSTMNMGLTSGDNLNIVRKNRQHWFGLFGLDKRELAIPGQVHSATVRKTEQPGIYKDTDGLYTQSKDVILSIQTADCLPIFIYEPIKQVVAAVHAGWQGIAKGIVSKTMEQLIKEYDIQPQRLKIAVGPGIQKCCFEVRKDVFSKFPEKFLSKHEDSEKRFVDIQGFVKKQFENYDVLDKNIFANSDCTHCEKEQYFSYRRDKNHSGRMLGLISLKRH